MFKLGHMANAFGVHFNPHFWGTGISLFSRSATLHVVACLPNLHQTHPPIVPNHISINPLWSLIGRLIGPIRENLTDPIFDQVDSHIPLLQLHVPTTPGLGIEVIEEEARRFLVEGLSSPIRVGT